MDLGFMGMMAANDTASLVDSSFGFQIAGMILGLLVCRLIIQNRRIIYYSILNLPRDIKFMYTLKRISAELGSYEKNNLSLAYLLDKTVNENPEKVLVYFEDEEWTAREIQVMSLKVARYFEKEGARKRDVVGLFMENRPEYICIWIGLSRIGCVTVLINTSLRQKALTHCIETVECSRLIYSKELESGIEELETAKKLDGVGLYNFGAVGDTLKGVSKDLKSALMDVEPINTKIHMDFADPMLYIYTSGTTGLPKAAVIKNSRVLVAAISFYYFCGIRETDRIYTGLPMYHISGTTVTGGLTAAFGVPVIIRKKFSAVNYWKDCIQYKATVGHYIGEMCRYLLAQPQILEETNHSVRMMFGNGVRPDVWSKFQERFKIKRFCESYGSTEGTANMVNFSGKVGSTGFFPLFLDKVIHLKIIKLNKQTGMPCRDPNGRVVLCGEGEFGELIGKILRNHATSDFGGYADKSASESKVLRDAFETGDTWFRSGDLFCKDAYGYFYFKDRMGDNYRWKGENCSATEIESVLSAIVGMQDVVVFGVNVPGAEGKAGMAVVCDVQGIVDISSLGQKLRDSLPTYARPLFIRITSAADITETYKLKKTEYINTGYNINLTRDRIFFLQGGQYVPLDKDIYEGLQNGTVRV